MHGLEKLPDGPALIIHYHGPTFLDILYLSVFIFIRKKKLIHIVADHSIFSIPGVKLISDVLQFMPGSQEECRKVLENGELLMISPGGVREALFSDENYTIIWRNRKGFAQVAIDAKVTKNALQCLIDKHQKIPGNSLTYNNCAQNFHC
uniref:Transmembrane protein 68-like n=1 Tax=Pseudonaja textilis TaxID=8673 RepID=A0A670XWK3_PSETE